MPRRIYENGTLMLALAVTAGLWISQSATVSSGEPNIDLPIYMTSDYQEYPAMVGDGSGGAIIAWQDTCSDGGDIYAQRVDFSGTVKWATDGVPICTASGIQSSPAIVSDSSGGAIIVWEDARSDEGDIYAQQVDSLGAVKWTADGVPICTASSMQNDPVIVSDGSGGAIITWTDERDFDSSIYAQRVDASGTVRWTTNGVAIRTTEIGRERMAFVDTSASIQTAIDYLSSNGGGTVVLLPGRHTIASTCSLKTNVSLIGMGWESEIYVNVNKRAIVADNCEDIIISNFALNGNHSPSINQSGLVVTGESQNIVIDKLWIHHVTWNDTGPDALLIAGGDVNNVVISDCLLEDIGAETASSSVVGLEIAHGQSENGLRDITVRDCIFRRINGLAAISIHTHGNPFPTHGPSHITVSNVVVDSARGLAFNVSSNSTALSHPKYISVSNLIARRSGLSSGYGNRVLSVWLSRHVNVTDVIIDTTCTGSMVTSGCEDVSFSNMRLYGSAKRTFYVNSAGSKIKDCELHKFDLRLQDKADYSSISRCLFTGLSPDDVALLVTPNAQDIVLYDNVIINGKLRNLSPSTVEVFSRDISLISPPNDSEVGARPTLQWESALEFIYTLEYSLDSTFTFTAIIDNIYQSTYTFQKDLNNNQVYYWRVWARDQPGVSILSSETRRFAVNSSGLPPSPPVLLIPDENAELRPWEYFVWTESTDLDPGDSLSYTLEISEQMETKAIVSISDVKANVLSKPVGSGKSIVVRLDQIPGWVSLQDDSIYFWRVKAIDNHGFQSQFAGRAFFYNKENSVPLKVDGGFWPTEEDIVNNLTPKIMWGTADDPDLSDSSSSLRYILQINDSQDLEIGYRYSYEIESGKTSFTLPEPLHGSHQWFYRVRAIDDEGAESPWSDVQFFTITLLICDLNNDGKVWLEDFNSFGSTFGASLGSSRWDPRCDLNGDGKIWLEDFSVFASNFGKSSTNSKIVAAPEIDASMSLIGQLRENEMVLKASLNSSRSIKGYTFRLRYDREQFELLRVSRTSPSGRVILPLLVKDLNKGEIVIADIDCEGQSLFRNPVEFAFSLSKNNYYPIGDFRITNAYILDGAGNTKKLSSTTSSVIPDKFMLFQNYPNPFNSSTKIRYQVPEASHIVISIYDGLGRKVEVLVDGIVDAGYHSVIWNAKDVASGVYLVRIESGDLVRVQKVMLVR